MSKFQIIINHGPFESSKAETAYQFCVQALEAGHSINQIFFYQQGVLNASQGFAFPTDEPNLPQRWVQLSEQYQIPLKICASAGIRRGFSSAEESDAPTLHPSFEAAGLTQWVTHYDIVDKTITF